MPKIDCFSHKEYKKFLVLQKALIFDESENTFLLIKSDSKREGVSEKGDFWDFPGGYVSLGEDLKTSLINIINKKVANIEFDFFEPFYIRESGHENESEVMICYLLKITNKKHSAFDHRKYHWLKAEQILHANDQNPQIKEILAKALEYLNNYKALNSWKRCQADFENYKKLKIKEMEDFKKHAKLDLIYQFLPVLDNFEASLGHVPEKEKDSAWVTGINYIRNQILEVLKKNGVEEIMVEVGEKFDPKLHEAISGEGKKQKISKVLQQGYRMEEKIIRPARVEVA